MLDVIIIGGGIIGTAIARQLSRYQLDILLLEKGNDVSVGSTKANSAIVHGGYAESHAKLKGRLCYQGRKQYRQLDEELHFGFDPIGSLVVAFQDDDYAKLQSLYENGLLNGLDDLEIIDHDRIMEIEPNINPDAKYALYCKNAGITSPYEMAIAMCENAIHNGVTLKLNTEVTRIEKIDAHYVVHSQNESFETKIIINCAGIYSGKIAHMVGIDDYTITPRSGAYLLFMKGDGDVLNHVVFQMPSKMGKGILVTPTYHNNLLVGPDAINETDINLATDAQRLIHIYNQALTTTTHINPQHFIRSFAGIRSVSDTDDFIIRQAKEGYIECAGIQSPGLTSAPAIADLVIHIINNEIQQLEKKSNFDPYRKAIIQRKQLRPIKEILPLLEIEGDERIICRCEQVSQATIHDALTRNIPVETVDGVKRRTRAGMGFCQGSFCRSRVIAYMEEVLQKKVDTQFDTEHSGINRVMKNDFLAYLKTQTKQTEQ